MTHARPAEHPAEPPADRSTTSSAEGEELYRALNAERPLPRLAPRTLRAAWWALRTVRKAKRDLRTHGLATTVAPPPAGLPWSSRPGVYGVLHRLEPTCLERALVLQSWLKAHRVERDVVIGVRKEDGAVKAHAWIDGITQREDDLRYTEIHRLPADR